MTTYSRRACTLKVCKAALEQSGTSLRVIAMTITLLGTTACTLPDHGPSTGDLTLAADSEGYELVKMTAEVAERLKANDAAGFASELINAPRLAGTMQLGVGDRVTVTIFESAQGGVFLSADGKTVLPDIVVPPSGNTRLPFAGDIQMRGQTVQQVEDQIVRALDGKAVEPQAQVTLIQSANASVTVSGEVHQPMRVPLSARGDRLAEALAATGGAKFPAHETRVAVTRSGKTSRASLHRIYNDPRQNIALRSGDLITLLHVPHSYTIIGSVRAPQDRPFSEPKISLLEALGQSQGLVDENADARGVFLFRREDTRTLLAHGLAPKPWWKQRSGTPTIYWIDMSQPQSIFMAQSVQIQDGDAIYVSTAGAVALRKVLSLFGLAVGSARQAQTLTLQ